MPEAAGPLVFLGDSITDCHRREDPLGLGGGYVELIAAELRRRGDPARVVNRGIAGERVGQMLARMQPDAVALAPAVLTVLLGVNDTLVAFFQGRPTPLADFERDVAALLATAAAPRVIVLEPFYADDADVGYVHWREGGAFIREDLDRRRAILRRLAHEAGAEFVPLQSVVSDAVAARGPMTVAPDGVHPSAFGHALIAAQWLAAYDAAT